MAATPQFRYVTEPVEIMAGVGITSDNQPLLVSQQIVIGRYFERIRIGHTQRRKT